MVKIRLSRIGAKGQPYYRVVVTDSRNKRDGAVIEIIGTYNPRTEPSSFEVDKERLAHWRKVGAQVTEPVLVLLGEAKPKRHQPKDIKKEEPAAPTAAPATEPLPAPTPAEGAETVKTEAPETTPEASPELAQAESSSEAASPEATPEVVAETVENTQSTDKTVAAATAGEPTSQEVKAEVAEETSQTDNPDETAKA